MNEDRRSRIAGRKTSGRRPGAPGSGTQENRRSGGRGTGDGDGTPRTGPSPARLNEAASALIRVLTFEHPADAVLSRYFRERPQLGQQDRAFVAEAVFGVLRRKFWLDHLAPQANVRQLLLLWLARVAGYSSRELGSLCSAEETQWLNRTRAQGPLPLSAEADLPPWVIERLLPDYSEDFVRSLGRALQEPAPLDLRVNSLCASREEVLAKLRSNDIISEPTPLSPLGLRLRDKPALNRNPLFAAGKFEVQDEGSQLAALAAEAGPGLQVADVCAGGGGKTLALAAAIGGKGQIYAYDIDGRRLAPLHERLARAGVRNAQIRTPRRDGGELADLAGRMDIAFVDAPCTGSGTWRRAPDSKWRLRPAALERRRAEQQDALSRAAALVKPGGRIVYVTCSILPDENDDAVAAFLARDAAFVPAPERRRPGGLAGAPDAAIETAYGLQMTPRLTGCDGFYVAVLVRR